MASYEYDIGVIGGGAAGLTVAQRAAQLGAKPLFLKSMILLAAGIFILLPMFSPAWSAVDHGIFSDLLARYNQSGVVDYAGFKKDEGRLDAYLDILSKVDPDHLTREEQFAFWVNAYNAWTIKLILTGYPGVDSIKDLGSLFKSPWKKKFVRIDGQTLTLDQIEHDILRPRFKDPRVHFAVNCASKGCPPLFAEPFKGEVLESQLNLAAVSFIKDPAFNRLEGNTLYVSKIFDWFSEDFDNDIVGFFKKYATGDLKQNLDNQGDGIRIAYLDYDWSLNGR